MSLVEKATRLRTEGKHEKAYKTARKVLDKCKNPESPVTYDLSVSCYYLGKKLEGRKAVEQVLAFPSFPEFMKRSSLTNFKFYASSIDGMLFPIEEKLPEGYFPSSPSLIPFGNGYLCNLRAVNYKITSTGAYDIKDSDRVVRTLNYMLVMDENMHILESYEWSKNLEKLSPRFPSRVVGLEDVRLFKDLNSDENGRIYFFATCCECLSFFAPRIVFGCLDTSTRQILFVQHITIEGKTLTCEKNWLPFVTEDNRIRFIYIFDPLTIYEINRETFETTKVDVPEKASNMVRFSDYGWRGSAPPILYNDGWLCTIHQVEYANPRKYYHRFVWFNKTFTERKFGPLFYFERVGIEYNVSACLVPDRVKIGENRVFLTYSVNDGSANFCSISNDILQEHLSYSSSLLDTDVPIEIVDTRPKKIILFMIVKNEEKVIQRCLDSCIGVIDGISICDTGSSDNTVQIILDFCKENHLDGVVHQSEWKNFSHNRTESFRLMKETFPDADYGLTIDADMILVKKPHFSSEKLTLGGYRIAQTTGSGMFYYNARIMSTKYNWKSICYTHEYWCPRNPSCPQGPTDMLEILDRGDGGCKADKFERDIRLCKLGLVEDSENEIRYMFYLAQTYLDTRQYDAAIEWYQKRIEKGGFYEEVYYSYYRIACAKEWRGDPWPEVRQAYIKAHENLPQRIEPLFAIARHYQLREEYPEAYGWLKKATKITFPSHMVLFLRKDIYEFEVWFVMGIVGFYMGEYQEAIDACEKALAATNFAEGKEERIRRNMQFSIDKLKNK